jgi:hypothetical protein
VNFGNNCQTKVRSKIFTIVSPCTFVDAVAIRYTIDPATCGDTPSMYLNGTAVTATINNGVNPRTATFPATTGNDYYAIFRLVTTGTC